MNRSSAFRSSLAMRFVVGLAVAAGGCGGATRGGTHGTNPGGNPGGGDDGGTVPPYTDDAGSVDPGGGNPDDTCSNQNFSPTKVGDPDILIIYDMSGSMSDGTPPKYVQVSAALTDVITTLDQKMAPIEWGLLFFPTDGNCGVDPTLPVPVGPGNSAAIIGKLNSTMPNGSTPLAAAVTVATNYYDTLMDNRAHYILIATDGEPNCDSGGLVLPTACMTNADCPMGQSCMTIPFLGGICIDMSGGDSGKAVAAAAAKGIRTFVVGIDLGGDSATLDALATAGGTARMGTPKYYPVADQMTLESTLGNITSQIISCSFMVSTLPMSNQMIVVTVGGQQVARDATHADGWDFDAATMTLTFYGNACTGLQQNPGVVSVGYTCPPPG